MTGKAAVVDSYPLLGYSLVQTIAKGVEIAGTTDGDEAREGARDVQGRSAARRDRRRTRRAATSRSQRSLLIIRYENGKPHSTGDFVRAEKVPPYPC